MVTSSTCLSCEEHDHNIHDYLSHFLGCTEIGERASFLEDDTHPVWKAEVRYLIDQQRKKWDQSTMYQEQGRVESTPKEIEEVEEIEKNALEASRAKREKWAENCRSELRRIRFIRATLAKSKTDEHLVIHIGNSGTAWRQCDEVYGYKRNIKTVRKWRESNKKLPGPGPRAFKVPDPLLPTAEYETGKDVNVPIIAFNDC